MIKLSNLLKEDEYVDQAYKAGDAPIDNPIDDYDELDVEQEDMDDFSVFCLYERVFLSN